LCLKAAEPKQLQVVCASCKVEEYRSLDG